MRNRVSRPGFCGLVSLFLFALFAAAMPFAARAAAGITSASWTALGPDNFGGRIRAIAIHPTQPNKMWVGSATGGIWRTTDAGGTWANVSDFLPSMSITALAVSPGNPDILYAGTGELVPSEPAIEWKESARGAGILKSVDGGATWAALPATNPDSNHEWGHVIRVAIHPSNGNILLASTKSSIPNSPGGVYRTADGGSTWTKVLLPGDYASDVQFDPLDGNKVIASKARSWTSADAGLTWFEGGAVASGSSALAFSRQSGVVYASTQDGWIARSTNGGQTWTSLVQLNFMSNSPGRSNAIWVDPLDSNHVIAGGSYLMRSTNGGANWTQISSPSMAGSVPAGVNQILASPGYFTGANRTIFVATHGGLFRATDIQAVSAPDVGWTALNNGLAITEFDSGAGHNGVNGRIIGGARRVGALLYPGSGTSWSILRAGDGGGTAVDPTDGSILYATAGTQRVHRSTTGGSPTVEVSPDFMLPTGWAPPVMLVSGNPDTMLVGGASRIWRSTNVRSGAPSWSVIGPIPVSGTSLGYLRSIAGVDGNPDLVWVAFDQDGVRRTFNATAPVPTWGSVFGTGVAGYARAILIESSNTEIVYVGVDTRSFSAQINPPPRLWKKLGGGETTFTWTDISGSLPALSVLAITQHPMVHSYLYVGTERGIFTSENSGATWSQLNDGPANVPVVQLFWADPATLVAVTRGRGMFRATVAAPNMLSVHRGGTGAGTITSAPAGILCGSTCSAAYPIGSQVTLTATAGTGSYFLGWSGSCSGQGSTCTVTLDAAKNVGANFNRLLALVVSKDGAGGGTVTSSPAGINCGPTCEAAYVGGTTVTLTATPNAYSVFSGWIGGTAGCTGTATCQISMNVARSVNARFTPTTVYPLSVSSTGPGNIQSTPAGINCGSACSANFGSGTTVTLTAVPWANSHFESWSGACTGSAPTCTIFMSQATGASAVFKSGPASAALTVFKSGTGSGPVTSSPAGIVCGSACAANFTFGSSVTLTATPNSGSAFAGWSDACSGTASTCTLTMDANKHATATFNTIATPYALTITKAGTGSGPVTSSPGGIACGSACSANFASGASVTLTATSNSGSVFAGWTGACSGTASTCVVTMNAAKNVTATFNRVAVLYTLTIAKSGSGSGPVTSSPAGIICGSACSASFASGTSVTLTATPNSGSMFAGWSGACTGTSTCVVTMSAAKSVTATFDTVATPYTLTITKSGTGSGPVTSTPSGIVCGSVCSKNFAAGATVTLTATANSGSMFAGWSGACAGSSSTCVVNMTGARNVTATFVPAIPLGQALDNTALTWASSGNAAWFGQTGISFDGVDAAQSGNLAANQVSILSTTVQGPGTLSFRWRVASQPGFDLLTFHIDGAFNAAISGDSGWQVQTWSIPAGTHTLEWRYAKDGSISGNGDRAWVDQVQYGPAGSAAR